MSKTCETLFQRFVVYIESLSTPDLRQQVASDFKLKLSQGTIFLTPGNISLVAEFKRQAESTSDSRELGEKLLQTSRRRTIFFKPKDTHGMYMESFVYMCPDMYLYDESTKKWSVNPEFGQVSIQTRKVVEQK